MILYHGPKEALVLKIQEGKIELEVVLDYMCGCCDGEGCDVCDGTGFILTDNGHAIFDMLSRHKSRKLQEDRFNYEY